MFARIVATVDDSVLRTEMAGLESHEEDAPKRILFFNPMSWLRQIRSYRRDEAWSTSLWQTFVAISMGSQIPVISEHPVAACGCRKFELDAMGDHLCTCTAPSSAKKDHDWVIWWPTLWTWWTRCLWYWISVSPSTLSEVALTLVLTDTYITLMISINH
jgi:hypothetical protein